MDLHVTFAANIKRFRKQRGLSQSALGEEIGVTLQSIFSYESGTNWPRPETMEAIAIALKVRPWQLLAGEGEGGTIPPELTGHLIAAARAAGIQVVDPSLGSGAFLSAAVDAMDKPSRPKSKKKSPPAKNS